MWGEAVYEKAMLGWEMIFSAIQEPIFVHDGAFRILLANPAYARLAGRPHRELLGRPYYEVFPRLEGPLPGCQKAMEKGCQMQEEVHVEGGTYLSCSFPLRDEGGHYLYSIHVLQDISEPWFETARRLASLLEVIHHVAQAQDLEMMARWGIEAALRMTGAEQGAIAWQEESGMRVIGVPPGSEALCLHEDLEKGIQVSFPGGRLCLAREGKAFTGDERTLVEGLGRLLATAFERQRILASLEYHARHLEQLLTLAGDLATTTEPRSLFRKIVEAAQSMLRLDFSTLLLLSGDGRLVVQDTLGFPKTLIGKFGLVKGQGLSTHVLETRKPGVVEDFRKETRFEVPQVVLEHGIASGICVPLTLKDEIFGVLIGHTRKRRRFSPQDMALYQGLAHQAAVAIKHALNLKAMDHILESFVEAMSRALEMRDPYTAGHQRRVMELSLAIAKAMGLDEGRIQGLKVAALVHDIGKIHIPAEILNRPGRISATELDLIKTHAQVGYDILKDVPFPWPVAEMVYQHHERLDGSGYPRGLKGEAILLEARILAVADVVEAMSSHRPYRPALPMEVALREIQDHRGVRYDPQVVDACLKCIEGGFAFSTAP